MGRPGKIKYDRPLLDSLIAKTGAELIAPASGSINSCTTIVFKCPGCRETQKKGFGLMANPKGAGAICKPCGRKRADEANVKWTAEKLGEVLARDGAAVDPEHDVKHWNEHADVAFICKCGGKGIKEFRVAAKYGAYCQECTTAVGLERRYENIDQGRAPTSEYKNKWYDMQRLNESLERDGAKMMDHEGERLHARSMISYVCKCGVSGAKKFMVLEQSGALCNDCQKAVTGRKISNTKSQVTHTLLALTLLQDNAALDDDFADDRLSVHSTIPFVCGCGQRHAKRFLMIKKSGALCNTCQKPQQLDRVRQCVKDRYGVDHVMQFAAFIENRRQKWRQIYGGDTPYVSDMVKLKSQQTCILKYGVPFPAQNPDVFSTMQAGRFALKPFTFADGTEVRVQGYEPFALSLLQSQGYSPTEIIVGSNAQKPPTVSWTDESGKSHVHHVDIFIHSEKRMIEVKSWYTYLYDVESIGLKQEAAIAQGYQYDIWIMLKDGSLDMEL